MKTRLMLIAAVVATATGLSLGTANAAPFHSHRGFVAHRHVTVVNYGYGHRHHQYVRVVHPRHHWR